MKVLLVRYNKVTNDAFNKLAANAPFLTYKSVDLSQFGRMMDIMDYPSIKKFLHNQRPYDAVVVGDVFWPSGQNICRICSEDSVPCHFLQHGQWVYITNKKSPVYTPTVTHLNGVNTHSLVSMWPYAMKSKIQVTGNPRYDNIEPNPDGDYVYFGPPVIREKSPSAPDRIDHAALRLVMRLKGIDKTMKVKIQPHYREGDLKQLKRFFPKAEFIPPPDDPLPWIARCNKVLTHRNSTTVLDAIAHGKLSVLANFERQNAREDDEALNARPFLTSFFPRDHFGEFALESVTHDICKENLKKEVRLSTENYIERAKKYIYLGNASERLARSIMEHEP
jgi:hypothetical protein